MKKVIIIGAGIAGLTLAAACYRAGIKTKIYDKAKQLRNIGGGLLLWPHSKRYLEWLGLFDCIKSYYIPVKNCKIINSKGEEIFREDYSSFYSLIGGEVLPIDRSLLQQALLSQLPENSLTLEKQCIDVKSNLNEATVFFTDGTQESADVIIGADGIHSSVRKSFNKTGDLHYTNNCWWGGIIEQKYIPALSSNDVFVALGLGKMCIVWPVYNNRFIWYLPVKILQKDFTQKNNLLLLQKICSGWNPIVEEIISSPMGTQQFCLPIYTLPPQTAWSTSRITLIGDAAHGLGPILGQGANQAIEDAFVLVNCLQNQSKNIPQILQEYEILRHERSKKFHDLENLSASIMINDHPDEFELFQQQIQHLNLATMYQELIPLVDENFCHQLAAATTLAKNKLL